MKNPERMASWIPGIRGRLILSMAVAAGLAIVGLGPFLHSMIMPVLVNHEGDRLLATAMIAAASVPDEREDIWMARVRKAWPGVDIFVIDLVSEGDDGAGVASQCRKSGTSPDRVIRTSILGNMLTMIDPDDTQTASSGIAAGWEALVRVPDHSGAGRILGLRVRDAASTGVGLWRIILLYGALVTILAFAGGLAFAHMTITRPISRTAAAATVLLEERPGINRMNDLARIDSAIGEGATIHRDDRRRMERQDWELQRMKNDLKGAQTQLIRAEKLASVGQLAAGVAHEIGNPTGIILGMSDILRQGGSTPDEVIEYSDAIHKATLRVDGIIRDMLSFARPARDEKASAPAVRTIESTVKLLEAHKSFRNVRVETTGPDLDPQVEIRPSQLQQVLFNLLLNAAHAMDGEGLISIDVRRAERRVLISVKDRGRGIPPKDLERIFDPFYTTKAPGEGTGLGLALSSQIVGVYGGDITVESAEGVGSSFVVRLWESET
ncbi:MAG TPA: ATP-binding protein [Myxococcota bacterium]|nr:ATP-binding protein [Myxococcota bacterium]